MLNISQKIKKNYYFIRIIKFINILIYSLIFFNLDLKIKIKHNYNLIEKIHKFENRNITEFEIKEFRKVNSKNILLDKLNYKKTIYPDISVILTLHNQDHCIHKALRSIQNQSLKNIEIIVIDDCSLDNSTDIIEEYTKIDKRIIFIKHNINEGPIKSRSEGIRMAKGKYITIIDGDDSYIHKDILYDSLYVANMEDLDIVEFKALKYRKGKFRRIVNNFKINNIIYQPELRTIFFNIKKNESIRAIKNRVIWAKLVKRKIFLKALNNIGLKYSDDYILTYEDTIMAVALYQTANSYYLMNEKGYYYSRDEKKKKQPSLKRLIKIKKCNPIKKKKGYGRIKLLQFLIEKTKSNWYERQMIYQEIISINYYTSFYKSINKYFESVFIIFDEMIKCRFLSKNQKNKLLFIYNKLKEKRKKTKYKE